MFGSLHSKRLCRISYTYLFPAHTIGEARTLLQDIEFLICNLLVN